MKTHLTLFALPLLAATLITAGCRSSGGTTDSEGRTVGQRIDDTVATSRVKGALGDAKTYKFNDVDVSTHQGVVQLSGWVNSQEQKSAAESIARNVPGVGDVVNNITVKEPTPNDLERTTPPPRRFPENN
jgi:hyperosmotically inducible protein